MSKLLNWCHYVLTDHKNQWEIAILIWLWYCGIFGWKAMTASTFDFVAFGTGALGVLGAGAGARWILTKVPETTEDE